MLGLRPGPGGVTRPAGRRLAACGMPAVTAEPAVTAAPDAAARGRRTRRPNHEAAPHTCIWNGRSSTRRPELARSHHHGSPYPHSPISQRQDLHPPTPLAPRCSMIAGSSGVYLPGTARDHGPRSDASPRDMTGCGGPGWGARPGGSGRVTAAGGYPLTGTMQVIGAGKLGWRDRLLAPANSGGVTGPLPFLACRGVTCRCGNYIPGCSLAQPLTRRLEGKPVRQADDTGRAGDHHGMQTRAIPWRRRCMTLRPRSYIRGCGARSLPVREIRGRVLAAGAAASPAIASVLAGGRGQAGWLPSPGPGPAAGAVPISRMPGLDRRHERQQHHRDDAAGDGDRVGARRAALVSGTVRNPRSGNRSR